MHCGHQTSCVVWGTHLSILWKIPLSSSDAGKERRSWIKPGVQASWHYIPKSSLCHSALQRGHWAIHHWKGHPAAEKEGKHPGQSYMQGSCISMIVVLSSSKPQEIFGGWHKAALLPIDMFSLTLCLQIVAAKSETLSSKCEPFSTGRQTPSLCG